MECRSIWKLSYLKTPCSHCHGCNVECSVVPPWTKASKRYVSFFHQKGALGVLAIFSSVFQPKNFDFSVLLFISVCGFYAVEHLVFGFVKSSNGSSEFFSGLSSIWAAVKRLRWSRTAAKRNCYWKEYVTNQIIEITSRWWNIVEIRWRSPFSNSARDFDLAMWSTEVDQFANYGFQRTPRAGNRRSSRNCGLCRVFLTWLFRLINRRRLLLTDLFDDKNRDWH